MTPQARTDIVLTLTYAVIVLAYAALGWAVALDGVSASDLTAMVVLGVIAMVAVLTAGWIYDARRMDR